MKLSTTLRRLSLLLTACLLFSLATSCTEESSNIGMGLQDPSTLYDGKCDTLYCTAQTTLDDSLMTKGYTLCVLGSYTDPTFGRVRASLFSQIACTDEAGISYQSSEIDSAVLSLAITDFYPYNKKYSSPVPLNFEIYQLAEEIIGDSTQYYSTDEIPVNGNCFYRGTVSVTPSHDTVVRIHLNRTFCSLLEGHSYTNQEFEEAIKGIRIRLRNDKQPIMLTCNLMAASSALTVYRIHHDGDDTTHISDVFNLGNDALHFNRFEHDYRGPLSVFNTNREASIDGSQFTYLLPLGGTRIVINFAEDIRRFREDHPMAIIHYAELIVPTASPAIDKNPTYDIIAYKQGENGTLYSIPDMVDYAQLSTYFDGHYDPARHLYRLRITQHLQKMLRSGEDFGTVLVSNGRRTSARRVVLNGSDPAKTGNNPIRIALVYSDEKQPNASSK